MTATTGELYRATDATGTEIRLNQSAERIVCLTATGIDILAELGLASVGYLSQGIADYPESYGDRAQQFTAIGSWMLPNLKTIRQLQPDLILGWRFPHRFYQHWLRQMAPTYLMSGSGYNPALARLRDVAQLTGRITEAETAIQQLESQLQTYRTIISAHPKKTVLMMGGFTLNSLSRRFIVETNVGTAGSWPQELAHYLWTEPTGNRIEPGLMNVSSIASFRVIRISSLCKPIRLLMLLSQQLAKHLLWKQLKAVQTHQVYEVEQFWHSGNGTRMIRLMLNQLLSVIYPQLFPQPSSKLNEH